MEKTDYIDGKSRAGIKSFLLIVLVIPILFCFKLGFRACTMPVIAEQSVLLLKIGRMIGLLAAILLLIDPVFSLKNKFFDTAFGLDKMLWFHKIVAIVCMILASLHPLILYISNINRIGAGNSEWPELMGAIALCSVGFLVCSSIYRKFLALEYEEWRKLHIFAAILRLAVIFHIFAIQPEARTGLYAYFLVSIFLIVIFLAIWEKVLSPMLKQKERSYRLSQTIEIAPDVFELALKPEESGACFDFYPGQFAYIQLKFDEFNFEIHPFTISSSSDNKKELIFDIKGSGDWTKQLKSLPSNAKADVIGPFGLFSPFLMKGHTEQLVLIAGGIGVTPFFSIVRTIAERGINIPILLLWSNKTSSDFFNIAELESIRQTNTDFSWKLFATQEKPEAGMLGKRIDKEALSEYIPNYKPRMKIMICGPQNMMMDTQANLVELGYPKSCIHYENFSYLD